MAYSIKTFQTASGPLTLSFDFNPPEPTDIQLTKFVPHICHTCEWRNIQCADPAKSIVDPCPNWAISCDAYYLATFEYYKDLHRKHYG